MATLHRAPRPEGAPAHTPNASQSAPAPRSQSAQAQRPAQAPQYQPKGPRPPNAGHGGHDGPPGGWRIPVRIAAAPAYLGHDFSSAAPGHRFLQYWRGWQGEPSTLFDPYRGKARVIGRPDKGDDNRRASAALKAENDAVLGDLVPLGKSAVEQVNAIRTRQQALLKHYGVNGLRISTKSTAPFATGLGNEHPIENGFAFLTPYGLPYLAGSGVKGILRRAAEELALDNDPQSSSGWTWLNVWWLFGFEGAVHDGSIWDERSPLGQAFARDLPRTAAHPDLPALIKTLFASDPKAGARFLDLAQNGPMQFLQACLSGRSLRGGLQARGALDFWDVFPKPAGDRLVVEIMTPHFGEYYRGKQPPHDSGAPVPVSFLAVPAKSEFDFCVVCQPSRLPQALQPRWCCLLDQALAHAFDWVGFGAKTSVGYGAMAATQPVRLAAPAASAPASGAAKAFPGGADAGAQTGDIWPTAKLTLNPGTGDITASFEGKSTAPLKNPAANALRTALGDERANKLKKNKELKNVSIDVEKLGNAWQLKGLTPT